MTSRAWGRECRSRRSRRAGYERTRRSRRSFKRLQCRKQKVDACIRVGEVDGSSYLAPCPVCWRMTIGSGRGRWTSGHPASCPFETKGPRRAHLLVPKACAYTCFNVVCHLPCTFETQLNCLALHATSEHRLLRVVAPTRGMLPSRAYSAPSITSSCCHVRRCTFF